MSSISCLQLQTAFSWDFLEEAKRLWEQGSEALLQVTDPRPAEPFQGGRVALAHDTNFLYVVAELEDLDIYNAATQFNEKTWQTGDVFEIFLKPENQQTYFEFHVTPENQNLQLRLNRHPILPKEMRGRKQGFRSRLITQRVMHSQTEMLPEQNRWRLLASIPLNEVVEGRTWSKEDVWLVSFCRYDYTRGKEEPVLSSTSIHTKVDFHDQSAWRRLLFS
jgi:hypothetical protein